MKNLSDILYSLQAAHEAFSAAAVDNALKITMASGETAYIPNRMTDKAFEAYHIILNIPLPPRHNAAETVSAAHNMRADENEEQMKSAPIIIDAAEWEAEQTPEESSAVWAADSGGYDSAWEPRAYGDYLSSVKSPLKK